MKKLHLIILICLFLVYTAGCSTASTRKTVESETEEIEASNSDPSESRHDENGVAVIAMLQSKGVSVSWIDGDKATFSHEGKNYFIRLSSMSLWQEGSDERYNYIEFLPGTENGFIYRTENDIIVDDETMYGILRSLELPCGWTIDGRVK